MCVCVCVCVYVCVCVCVCTVKEIASDAVLFGPLIEPCSSTSVNLQSEIHV